MVVNKTVQYSAFSGLTADWRVNIIRVRIREHQTSIFVVTLCISRISVNLENKVYSNDSSHSNIFDREGFYFAPPLPITNYRLDHHLNGNKLINRFSKMTAHLSLKSQISFT